MSITIVVVASQPPLPQTCTEVEFTCVPLGGDCDSTSMLCTEDAFCDLASTNSTCVALPRLGESCTGLCYDPNGYDIACSLASAGLECRITAPYAAGEACNASDSSTFSTVGGCKAPLTCGQRDGVSGMAVECAGGVSSFLFCSC